MYLNTLIGLLSAASRGHEVARQPFPTAPKGLSELSDRQLRDIGYVRERSLPFRHLMWM